MLGIAAAGCQSLSPESVASGRAVYAQHCVACHGPAGDGQGEAAYLLYPRPRDFVSGGFVLENGVMRPAPGPGLGVRLLE